jgi:hypothetical protein
MEEIQTMISAFFASDSGLVVKALLVASFVVFALGVTAAIKDKTFNLLYIDSFVRSTIMGRVVPVLIVLLAGYVSNEQLLTSAGIITGGAVAAGMIASAIDSIRQLMLSQEESAARNTLPQA